MGINRILKHQPYLLIISQLTHIQYPVYTVYESMEILYSIHGPCNVDYPAGRQADIMAAPHMKTRWSNIFPKCSRGPISDILLS